METREEKALYRVGRPIELHRRRELGVCKWGHPFYVVADINGELSFAGENVAVIGMSANDVLLTYCKACHRCQVKASEGRKLTKRRAMNRRNRLRREGRRRMKARIPTVIICKPHQEADARRLVASCSQ